MICGAGDLYDYADIFYDLYSQTRLTPFRKVRGINLVLKMIHMMESCDKAALVPFNGINLVSLLNRLIPSTNHIERHLSC